MGIPPNHVDPEASYEQREGLELAFVAALQHLAATQCAMLILREAVGFSASEVATMLQISVSSVNSGYSVRAPRYASGSDRYVFTSQLVEDATFAMPPLATWYAPRAAIATWAREFSLSGAWRWMTVLAEANAQPALGEGAIT